MPPCGNGFPQFNFGIIEIDRRDTSKHIESYPTQTAKVSYKNNDK